MPLFCTRPRCAATIAALSWVTLAALTACGDDDGRAAAAVTASISGSVVTDESTDLGSIVIGWGETHSDTEITTPRPDEVSARCYGRGKQLAVDITAPHGWKIRARHGAQILTIENTDQYLAPADVETKNEYLDTVQAVDWSQPDHIDIAATIDAPQDWNRADQPRRIYLSLHVDCTE
ncbi:hypothetical protein HYG77_37555 (plasmid) [Rhodococcus sp. ZPP]|nr:hypothetical protein HYG77_37555 [Rhodococcus sp. ZPP]